MRKRRVAKEDFPVGDVGLGVGAWFYWAGNDEAAAASPGGANAGAPAGGGGRAGGRGRGAAMAVEVGTATRRELIDYITVVGNLIGETTVDVVPRVSGRLDSVQVQMGDRVARGQQVAKVEVRGFVCSPLARARETAEIVAERIGIEPEEDARFCETDTGDWTDRSFADIKAEDRELLGHLHLVAAQLVEKLGIGDGYRLVLNCKERAGQTVPHLHLHLLGGRGMSWPPG